MESLLKKTQAGRRKSSEMEEDVPKSTQLIEPEKRGRSRANAPVLGKVTTAAEKLRLRRRLDAHLADLGYTNTRPKRPDLQEPDLIRISPVRRHIAYGEVVLREDFDQPACHQRLLSFSQRRTRNRHSLILFFIGTLEKDQVDLATLLEELGIRDRLRGGHVQVVLLDGDLKTKIAPANATKPKVATSRAPKPR